MSDTFWKGYDAMDKKKPDYGSWRSMAAGTIGTGQIKNRSFLDEKSDFQTTVDGLLGLMPIGCRNVTYIPAGAMEEIGKGDVKDEDIGKLPGVFSVAHGPYLDDWSKVPTEIAAKYNTSPSFVPPK